MTYYPGHVGLGEKVRGREGEKGEREEREKERGADTLFFHYTSN